MVMICVRMQIVCVCVVLFESPLGDWVMIYKYIHMQVYVDAYETSETTALSTVKNVLTR